MEWKIMRWILSVTILALAFFAVFYLCKDDTFGLCLPFMGFIILFFSLILLLLINLDLDMFSRLSLLLLFFSFVFPRLGFVFEKGLELTYGVSFSFFLFSLVLTVIFAIVSLRKNEKKKIYSYIAIIVSALFILQLLIGFSLFSTPPITTENVKLNSYDSEKVTLEVVFPSKLFYPSIKLTDIRCDIRETDSSGWGFRGEVFHMKEGQNELKIPEDEIDYNQICCWDYWSAVGEKTICFSILE